MALKVQKKNVKLKFLYRQSRYLNPAYKRLLSNALIQPRFLYECSSWFPLFKKNLEIKLQKAQNKCVRFCQNLPPRSLFRKINRLVFKYWNGIVPGYIHEMFHSSVDIAQDHRWYRTHLCGKHAGQKSVSFLRPKIWSKINSIKNVKIFLYTCSKESN